jgi:hypothetical protein
MEAIATQHRPAHRHLSAVSVKHIIWKPALLIALGWEKKRRKMDKWIAMGWFPKPDGTKFGHPWWFVSTYEEWLRT